MQRLTLQITRWFAAVLLSGGMLISVLLQTSCATGQLHAQPDVTIFDNPAPVITGPIGQGNVILKVMTLNVAHGRGDGFHQLFQSNQTTLNNLDRIVALLDAESPDVVALQESDGPSFWSGNFDHNEYLAERGSYAQSVPGTHMDAIGLSYGTALLSRLDLNDPEAITFDPDISPMPKGFIVSQIDWPGQTCTPIDVVSLHLDFMGEANRRQQANELIETLRNRNRPVIVMGDFNTEWRNPDSTVAFIARELGLKAYEPGKDGLDTFPYLEKRLDWILVSPDIDFHSYRVSPAVVSDHRGVVAELRLNTGMSIRDCECAGTFTTADNRTGAQDCPAV